MSMISSSRRGVLKQLLSMTALGASATLRIPGAIGKSTEPASTSLDNLIRGKVIRREDRNYELWRQSMVWHMSKPDRYPQMMVRAESEQDVIDAVKYAARERLKVSVRSGGHNSTGSALRDDALVIDVSTMEDIYIDSQKQIASIQPGVRSEQMIVAARARGLSFPVPHCPSVGLSGFTMGGGIGLNYPQCGGMATFSIMAADIITANGEKLLASAEQNPDLYWAVRGVGPGFFGVVTRLYLQLYPLPESIMASSYIFPLDQLETVTEALNRIRQENDVSRVELITLLMHHPEVPAEAPPEESKICFFTAFVFEDSETSARAQLKPFAESVLAEKCLVKMEHQSLSYEALYENYFSLDDSAGRMARYAVDNVLTNEGTRTLHALADHLRDAPSKDCHVLGSFNMKLEERTDACLSVQADGYVGCYAIWDDQKRDQVCFEWLEDARPFMMPFAEGHYVNEVEGRGHPERYRACFTQANWDRLQRLRKQYDPNKVFHHYLGHS